MGPHRSRREFLGMATVASLGLAVGCARRSEDGGTGSGPVTVKHVFGETTIPAPPTRVVSAGLTEHDDLLAVGVIPIAVTKWFGEQAVWPWAQAKLGAAKPAILNLDNGIQVESIAALKPGLIVAVNAGLDADTYRKKLSEIAPTIAQSGPDAFFEPWKEQATAVGRAVYKSDEMARIVDAVEEKFTAVAQANPGFKDRSVALMNVGKPVDPAADSVSGWRTEFLTAMGFDAADAADAADAPDAPDAEVVIWSTDSEAQRPDLLADPAVAGWRPVRTGRNVFTTADLAGAIAYASPLSYPVVAEQLPALVAKELA